MSELKIFSGTKEDLDVKYLEQLFLLQQQREKETFPFLPPDFEYYRLAWQIPDISWMKKFRALAVNEREQVVGYGLVGWNIKYDNLDQGYFDLYVKSSERRKGYGSKILSALLSYLPSHIKTISASTVKESAGESFLQKINQEPSYTEQFNVADLQEFDIKNVEEEAEKQRAVADKKGYKIMYVDNANYANYVDYPTFVQIVEQIWKDMPREQLSAEDEKVTVERYKEIYDLGKQRGFHYYTFIAIHDETKKPVAYTKVGINKYQPWVAWQDDTGVIPEHRGNGLGLTLKYQLLHKLLKETEARYWVTGNAASNKYMIKINRILKHKVWFKEVVYEFTEEKLKHFNSNGN
ncbi:MAG: GNAT family N-acetyltransferase [Candidatus Heimdallarchaeaceae archaeon]